MTSDSGAYTANAPYKPAHRWCVQSRALTSMSESAKPAATTATAPATAESEQPSAARGRGLPAASRVEAATPPVDASSLQASDPARVGGYRLMARLGAGGMADVFYSLTSTGRPVAVKVFRPTGGGAAACHREYQLARAAGADCTASALGYGTSSAVSYLVTAYLPGYRCGTTLMSGPTREQWLWQFGAALAGVLAALHAHGVVHCDVKPSNLLVRGHNVRVIDFGISRYVDEPPLDDRTVQCSPGWAAPEQLSVGPPTPAVDVFAWGCVLAYLAGGIRPFASRDGQEWYERVQAAEPNLSKLPPALGEVVRWSLARSPRNRPSAAKLAMICQALASARR
jgi:serine/threonine protein kinase